MQTNEEHCNVSQATANYFISELQEDFRNSIRPRIRYTYDESSPVHETIDQKVDGEVAYVAKETLTFGRVGEDNDNTFTLEEGADVNIPAGQEIVFKPGFTAKAGSKLHAKIDPDIDYPKVLKSTVLTPEPVAMNTENDYKGIVYDYSTGSSDEEKYEQDFASQDTRETDKDIKTDETTEFTLSLHPNPAKDEIFLDVAGIKEGGSAIINIYDPIGAIIYQSTISDNGKHRFDISQLISGNYYLKGEYKSKYITIKFVKL